MKELLKNLETTVLSLFEELNTVDKIAQRCRELNIEGYKNHPTSSPLVKLVRHYVNFFIWYENLRWYILENGNVGSMPSPMVCAEFEKQEISDLIVDWNKWSFPIVEDNKRQYF